MDEAARQHVKREREFERAEPLPERATIARRLLRGVEPMTAEFPPPAFAVSVGHDFQP
jgi:hypothetical protein